MLTKAGEVEHECLKTVLLETNRQYCISEQNQQQQSMHLTTS